MTGKFEFAALRTGLFIGTGSALRTGGPGGVLIAWIIMGIMWVVFLDFHENANQELQTDKALEFRLISTVQNLGEMAIMFPVTGGFYTLISRFIDESWGFAM